MFKRILKPTVRAKKLLNKNIHKNIEILNNKTVEGNTIKTITKKYKDPSGYLIKEITNIKQQWKKLSKPVKGAITAYILGAVTTNIAITYNNGKTTLAEYRQELASLNRKQNSTVWIDNHDCRSEWDAVYYGCKKNGGSKLYESITWPTTLISHIMPHAILSLNKK